MATYEELRKAAEAVWAGIESPQRTLVKVGVATCSRAAGAEETLEALKREIAARGLAADLMTVGCLGLCYAEPLVEVHHPGQPPVLYGNVTPESVKALVEGAIAGQGLMPERALAVVGAEALAGVPGLASLDFFAIQMRRLMANCGVIDPGNIDHYIARGGYEGLANALRVGGEAVIKEVLASGLWGRGGAAFPTGRKWEFLRGSARKPKYMICNADEGDPGSFVNRNLMESDPHLVIEGMIIGAIATDAQRGFVYIRDEYPVPIERMRRAVEQARAKGLLGEDILGSGFSFDIEVVRGAGAYVCGEETGLIASLEDRRGMPKIRPPFPAQAGVFAQPSNVNNVESYANVPLILRHGAAWYASVGTDRNKGTKMFSLSGNIQRVGVLEVPLGTPLRDVLMVAGGGPPPGQRLKGVQPGGPLSGVIPASELDIALEPEPFRERGMLMGSGGLVAIDDRACIVDLCIYFQWFAEDESCGRCTTCFAGTRRLLEMLRRIADGRGREADLELVKILGETMRYANCAHGQAAPTSIMSMLRFFESEVMEHVRRKRCPAKVCRGLVRYEVVHQSELLERAEAVCPTGAIVRNGVYRIDQSKCIKCDACREVAPYAVAMVDEVGLQ